MSMASKYKSQIALIAIILLALTHAGLYASFLPPWGLIDEEHHLHYIQYFSETGTPPVVGETYLSQEIVDALFRSARWETFGWNSPLSADPVQMGLEGHSYEGYQPPLFYAIMSPLFILLPGNILTKLFAFRWIIVGLSTVTVLIVYQIGTLIWRRDPALALFPALFMAISPERISAVSRVNNDVLLELLGAAFIWVCTKSMIDGLTIRRSQLIGLCFGLGMLTKFTMAPLSILAIVVFWRARKSDNFRNHLLWAGGTALLLVVPLALRNIALYGDLSGFAAFRNLGQQLGLQFETTTLGNSLVAIIKSFWIVWWQQGTRISNLLTRILDWGLLILLLISLLGFIHKLRSNESREWNPVKIVLASYAITVGSYAVLIVVSQQTGMIPVIQGRFFLPVIAPVLILLMVGFLRSKLSIVWITSQAALLLISNFAALFLIQLPAFYNQPLSISRIPNDFNYLINIMTNTMTQMTWDKPGFLTNVSGGLIIAYIFSIILTGLALFNIILPNRLFQGIDKE